jgi:hypothetical protein
MVEQHFRTGKSHHFFDFFAIFRFIAMNRTVLTERFILFKLAMFQPLVGIVFQLLAIRAQSVPFAVFETAIDTQHFGNGFLLAVIHYLSGIFQLRIALLKK